MSRGSRVAQSAQQFIGRPGDWQIRRPAFRPPTPGVSWIGVTAIAISIAVAWPAFSGAQGEDGNVAFGLFIGATSITLMAWSFLLAVRLPSLEPLFGGLDRMYRAHRWAGVLAVVAMFLHTSVEPEIEGGIRGASRSLANDAEGLAGTGETMLYILVGISLIRWFPYRYWRWTHKLLGIPYAFACLHFFTAEKPYANGSAWGWWFGAVMIVGLVAYLVRVVGRDMFSPGVRYRVSSAVVTGSSLDLRLSPLGRELQYRAGQFVFIKVQLPGLREPHAFTVAAAPSSGELRFFIRDLGDWTTRMHRADLEGADVFVEGPYGHFAPTPAKPGRVVWVAGGVGITPFLSASAALPSMLDGERPTLFYCVRDADDAMALSVLQGAAAEGRIDLELQASAEGRRFNANTLREHFGDRGLTGAHVAVCGPASLVASVERSARELGARDVEHEDFDIRQGFGPDVHYAELIGSQPTADT